MRPACHKRHCVPPAPECHSRHRGTELRRGAPLPLPLRQRRLVWVLPARLHRQASEPKWLDWAVLSATRSEEHTSELQSLMRISYAVFCLKKKISIYQATLTYNPTNTLSTKQHTELTDI